MDTARPRACRRRVLARRLLGFGCVRAMRFYAAHRGDGDLRLTALLFFLGRGIVGCRLVELRYPRVGGWYLLRVRLVRWRHALASTMLHHGVSASAPRGWPLRRPCLPAPSRIISMFIIGMGKIRVHMQSEQSWLYSQETEFICFCLPKRQDEW